MDLIPLVGADPCALLSSFGIDCQPCSDGSGPTCLAFLVDSAAGDEVPGSVVPRTQYDIDTDPACGGTPPDPTTTPTTSTTGGTGTGTGGEPKGQTDDQGGCGCDAAQGAPAGATLALGLIALAARRRRGV